MKKMTNNKLAGIAILSALSIVFALTIHFPILPAAAFLEYDPADIPIFIATFMYGPLTGIIITAIVAVLQGVTVSAASGPYGILMHFLMTGIYVLVTGLIYQKVRSIKGVLIAMLCGMVAWIGLSIPMNLLITPLYTGAPVEAVKQMILPILLPFNAIKVGINTVATFLIYKRLKWLFNKMKINTEPVRFKKAQEIYDIPTTMTDAQEQKAEAQSEASSKTIQDEDVDDTTL